MNVCARLHPGVNLHHTDPETHEAAETIIFGFWIFLMADLVIFALLFATYAAMSVQGVASGPAPATLFSDIKAPFLETIALLSSSVVVGMAMLALKYDTNTRAVFFWLAATALLGAFFLGMELRDFHTYIAHFDATPQTSGFLSAFYLLVGTHGVHIASALLWMGLLLIQLKIFGMRRDVKLRLMRFALFWHMLDIVWVGIFSFVYLIGAAS